MTRTTDRYWYDPDAMTVTCRACRRSEHSVLPEQAGPWHAGHSGTCGGAAHGTVRTATVLQFPGAADPTVSDEAERLLAEAERLYRGFARNPFDRDLSRDAIEILLRVIPAETETYVDQLAVFTERWRSRLTRAYRQFGATSSHFLDDGRYALAAQPESLIVFERLAHDRYTLRDLWEQGPLDEVLLYDMAEVWGIEL